MNIYRVECQEEDRLPLGEEPPRMIYSRLFKGQCFPSEGSVSLPSCVS
jgi:hypothetical protein